MTVLILIATIIHMNHGFEFPEALGRGVVSALMVAALGCVIGIILYLILALINWMNR